MRDVAQLAGVSQSTVSRVLNPSSTSAVPISEETVQRVQEAVRQLGYHPNLTASSLRGQRTMLIAMMIADISNPFYHFMVRNVQEVARQHNFDLLISNSDHAYENERHFVEAIMRRPVDGVILVPYHLDRDAIDELVQRTGASVVVLGSQIDHPMVDVVYADDHKATFEAVTWLIEERHHRRIGFIAAPHQFAVSQRRLAGYRQAMKQADLEARPAFIREGDWTIEGGYRAMMALLHLPESERPTAVFACNDLMAIGALSAAQEVGVRVPEDVALVGFDNIPETTRTFPKLTTVAQYPVDLGRQLATALFERIEGVEAGPGRRFEIPCKLIIRESA